MSFDTSRYRFDPWKDYSGVVMEQGRVQLDSDWNEWLAQLNRRIQVGTLLSYSWGYDQTNVDFFQVVEKRGRVVIIREIGCETVEGSQGFMCDQRRPVKDSFFKGSETFRKIIGPYSISMEHGSAHPVSEDSKQYCSWYA